MNVLFRDAFVDDVYINLFPGDVTCLHRPLQR